MVEIRWRKNSLIYYFPALIPTGAKYSRVPESIGTTRNICYDIVQKQLLKRTVNNTSKMSV
jgi:hypothetical protein